MSFTYNCLPITVISVLKVCSDQKPLKSNLKCTSILDDLRLPDSKIAISLSLWFILKIIVVFFSQSCINQNFYTMNNLCYSNHLCTGNNVKVKVTADIITVISLYAWLSFRIFIDLAHGHVLWLDENMRKSPREEDRLQSALVHVTPIHMYTEL